MQVEMLNRRAMGRYQNFVAAMELVRESLDELDGLIAKVPAKPSTGSGWTVATRDELTGYRRQATDELERLRETAKKYEAELVSRDWRV
ncbi:hypothetical protein SacmaDRAFT_3954 [Saccharomonospora marina XMU15]|uniref:Uncharacterized protein n=1 Tax=Saccharomonospora marina XMU15 TaxID=882083 RepID=H5X3T4_9PSEU|nr:hypothetical protein [Saccharomonospora marina]EHR52152.1 hypothetical protein SacmaDRAFT_3954 [Saccharomonospora marina XMU15]